MGLLRPPASVLVGEGAAGQLGDQVAGLGKRVLVVTDPTIARGRGFGDALSALRERPLEVDVLEAAVAELPRAAVEAATAEASSSQPEVIVGFGGGSCLDLAKLIALGLTWEGPLDRWYGEGAVPGPCLPVVGVPTTAGTGSEVTPVAVLSDPERELKVGVSSVHLTPRAAICDPLLTHGAPPAVSASAGIDALAHAIEAFTARRRDDDGGKRVFVGKNTLSDVFALRAMALLAPSLARACEDEPAARAAALEGSLCAGLAFATAGTALAHALQYPVGARSRSAHGVGVGILLPPVMRYNAAVRDRELGEVARAMGVGDSADAAIAAVAELVAALPMASSLAGLGMDRGELPEIAELALGIGRLVDNNPRPADRAGALAVLEAAWRGGLPAALGGEQPK